MRQKFNRMRTSDSLLWKILRFFQLNRIYRAIKDILPSSVVNKVSDITLKNVYMPLVDEKQLEQKYEMAWKKLRQLKSPLGDYLEFGVSRGHSMACMHRVVNRLKLNQIRLFGFDSFEGMPATAAEEDLGEWKPGQFASAIEETREFLNIANIDWNRTQLIKGWFTDTLNPETTQKYGIRKASIIMVDCDIYSAAKTALNYSLPFITDYAVVFFDDWRDDITFGEYKAYSEFLDENKLQLRSEKFGTYEPTGMIFLLENILAGR